MDEHYFKHNSTILTNMHTHILTNGNKNTHVNIILNASDCASCSSCDCAKHTGAPYSTTGIAYQAKGCSNYPLAGAQIKYLSLPRKHANFLTNIFLMYMGIRVQLQAYIRIRTWNDMDVVDKHGQQIWAQTSGNQAPQ